MQFSKHYFVNITFAILANLVILTTAAFKDYEKDFDGMFILINLCI
jgi:hypothetical protein